MVRILIVFLLAIVTVASSVHAQCPAPNKVFLPTADKVRFDGYARHQDAFENYLVVSARDNDSLSRSAGIAYVYKMDGHNTWIKIAELAPSDPQQELEFGYQVAISGSTIAVRGAAYDDNGSAHNKIYIYEKPNGGEWSSGTETYQINISSTVNWMADFELSGDDLVATVGFNGKAQMNVYKKIAGVFTLVQQIEPPADKRNIKNFGQVFVANDLIVVAATQFYNNNNSIGAVFLYQKNNGLYPATPDAKLTPANLPSDQYIGFGVKVAIDDHTVFVGASDLPPDAPNGWHQGVYIYEKPLTGWVNSTETSAIISEEWISHSHELEVNGDYVFITGTAWNHVRVYKKNSASWASGFQTFKIDNFIGETTFFGYQISATSDHLVIGAPDDFGQFEGKSESVVSYYLANGDWENITTHNQILTETTINATGDAFGDDISSYHNLIAVSAPEDDEVKSKAGAVYVFDIDKDPGVFSKLLPVNPQIGTQGFGYAVGLEDSVLFVSAVYEDSLQSNGTTLFEDMGKVYVYRLSASGWKYHSYILSPQVKNKSQFGQDIACSKGYVAVTEYYRFSGNDYGRVHIYKEDVNGYYRFLATLRPAQDVKEGYFGKNILLNDSVAVIRNQLSGSNRTVFIYNKKGEWTDATEDAWIIGHRAFSIVMDEGHIVIGDYLSHAAHIFQKPMNGWKGAINKTAQLSRGSHEDWDYFGYSVAIDRDNIFVGAPHSLDRWNYTDFLTNNDNSIKPGTVYRYSLKGEQWTSASTEDEQLHSEDPEWLDGFGSSLLISDRRLIVSSVNDNTSAGFRSGSVQAIMLAPSISTAAAPICANGPSISLVAYPSGGVWSGSGITPNSNLFDPSLLASGYYPVTYTINGCEATINLEVINPQVTLTDVASEEQLKCKDAVVSLFLESNIDPKNYFWFFETEGQFNKIDSMKSEITVKQPGSYYAEIDHEYCPSYIKFFTVSDEDPVEIDIEPTTPICSDEPLTLSALPEGGTWTGSIVSSDGLITPSGNVNNVYPVAYTFISALGCEYKMEIPVTIDRLLEPVVLQTGNKICTGNPVTLEIAGDDQSINVEWFRESDGSLLGTERILSAEKAGNYFAIVSKHTCSFQTNLIHLPEATDSLYVPNVFTPNGDSHNDYFEIASEELYDFQLQIVNRYGKSIYVTNHPDFKWTGENFPSGVYFWVIHYKTCDDQVMQHKGWVHLFR